MSKEMNVSEAKSLIGPAIEAASERLREVSNEIWKHPELLMEEVKAHSLLTNFLEKEGFLVEKSFVLKTAFRAIYSPATETDARNVNVCVICEYDAMPDIGHACGRNLIAEAGLAAAIGIKSVMERYPEMKIKLTVMGTPAEEGGGGKIHLIRAGAFKDVDIAMMVDPFKFNAIYPNVLSVSRMDITYSGKASHAAAFPWEGVNALDAAVSAYTAVSLMRQHMKSGWRVHGIITNGGVKVNVIPDTSSLKYMMRAQNNKELDELTNKVKGCFQGAAIATGCDVSINDSIRYSNMNTNSVLAELYRSNALELGMKYEDIQTDKISPSFSTDMGDLSFVVPSIHPTYALNTEYASHSSGFANASNTPEAHAATLTAAAAMSRTAIDAVLTPGVMEKIKQEFKLIS